MRRVVVSLFSGIGCVLRRRERQHADPRRRRLGCEWLEERRLLAASVGDWVWQDVTGNGLQDPGEPGVAGAVVEVFSAADNVSQGMAITDVQGHYQLTGLADSVSYYLVFHPPVGFTFTAAPAQPDTARDSDANPATGKTAPFTLTGDTSRVDLDAGLLGAAPGFGFAVGFGAADSNGTSNGAEGQATATDTAGNVYVTGYFRDTIDCDPGPGNVALTSVGGSDMVVAKYTSTGALVWARQFGGSSDDQGRALAVASDGSLYVTGIFLGNVDFDPGPGEQTLTSAGNGGQQSSVLIKFDSTGQFAWAGAIGGDNSAGTSDTQSSDVALGSDGSIYLVGSFQGQVDFDPTETYFYRSSLGFTDIFVCKLDATGSFLWAKTMGGGNAYDQGRSLAVGADGSVAVTGVFLGTTDFNPGGTPHSLTSAGDCDAFLLKLNTEGSFLWVRAIGSPQYDGGSAIAVGPDGAVTATGIFFGRADLNTGSEELFVTPAGNSDIFLVQLDSSGNFRWAQAVGGTGYDNGNGVAVTRQKDVYLTGSFSQTVDFDAGPGNASLTSAGGSGTQAAFISHLDATGNFIGVSALGGTSNVDRGRDLAVASDGNVVVTGAYAGTPDFNPGPGVFSLTTVGSAPYMFLAKLSTPTAVTLSGTVVSTSSAVGTSIGTFATVDPSPNDSFTYALVPGTGDTDNGRFAVAGNVLRTAVSLAGGTESTYSVRVRATDALGLWCEQKFTLLVSNGHQWQNPISPLDVDGSGAIVPLDVLQVINYLNTNQAGPLPIPPVAPFVPPPFLDVNGDDWVTPLDVLVIINYLNHPMASAPGPAAGEAQEITNDSLEAYASAATLAQPSAAAVPALQSLITQPAALPNLGPNASLLEPPAEFAECPFPKLSGADEESLLSLLARDVL